MPLPTREEIIEALGVALQSSSIDIGCTACGREHFTGDPEVPESFREGHERDPDKYVYWDIDSICWFNWQGIDGKTQTIVLDCPCHSAYNVGVIIWNNRFFIARFLKELARVTTEQAEREQDCADRIGDSVQSK